MYIFIQLMDIRATTNLFTQFVRKPKTHFVWCPLSSSLDSKRGPGHLLDHVALCCGAFESFCKQSRKEMYNRASPAVHLHLHLWCSCIWRHWHNVSCSPVHVAAWIEG